MLPREYNGAPFGEIEHGGLGMNLLGQKVVEEVFVFEDSCFPKHE